MRIDDGPLGASTLKMSKGAIIATIYD